MKAKLIKTEKMYVLSANNAELHKFKSAINTGNYGWVIADEYGGDILKLSAKNCDEIFGVVDVDKFVREHWENNKEFNNPSSFKAGFNKAMELNKDKLFGVKEVVELCKILLSNPIEKCGKTYQELTDNYIQSLQQPTEIEVEIEMEAIPADRAPNGWDTFPKLDLEGCLILKRYEA